MQAKYLLGLLIALFLLINLPSADAALVTVCSSGCDATTVQGGIDTASNDDEVRIIDSAYYNESLNVNKPLLLTSNSTARPTIFYSGATRTININADNVTVMNLTIVYNGTASMATIEVAAKINATITNNNINNTGGGDSGEGVFLNSANYSLVANNTIFTDGGSSNFGIDLNGGTNNTAINNVIYTNGNTSVSISEGIDVTSNTSIISYNTIHTTGSGSANRGIYLSGTNGSTVNGNTIYTNGTTDNYGILVAGSSTMNIVNENAIYTNGTSTGQEGIQIQSSDNIISGNTINTNGKSNSNHGIHLAGASYAIVKNNTIYTNGTTNNYGIWLRNNNVTIYNNTIYTNGTLSNHGLVIQGDANNSVIYSSNITADSPDSHALVFIAGNNNTIKDTFLKSIMSFDIRDQSTSAYNNYLINNSFNFSSFNFSATSVGKMFVQYSLDVRVLDGSSNAVEGASVTVNDSSSVPDYENPTANLSLTTNSSGYITTATFSSFMANRTYNSSSGFLDLMPNTITVSKSGYSNAVNVTTNSSQSLTISLSGLNPPSNPSPPPSSGGGGGGGGGASDTTIVKVNVTKGKVVIEIPTIAANKSAKVNITKTEDVAFRSMEIIVKNSVNKINITIIKIDSSPVSVSGLVYHYIQIDKFNMTDNDISKVKINFTVPKSWISGNSINESTILLKRYDGSSWTSLVTAKLSENSEEILFNAESPGLSVYSITGEQLPTQASPSQSQAEQTQETGQGQTGKASNSMFLVVIVIIVALGIAVFYFMQMYKPKKA